MTEHTQGPWTQSHNVSHEPTVIAENMAQHPTPNGSFIVAQMFGDDKMANARLIASAPDLLAALEAIAALENPRSGDRGPIRRARHIAKCAIATT